MARIWGIATNDKYVIECSGQTTYIYTKEKVLIKKLTGQLYAYNPLIAPNNTLWVKAKTGHMYVYSLEDFSLIKKWKEAKYSGQDGNHILSWDGKKVIDIILEANSKPWVTFINFYDIETLEVSKIEIETTMFVVFPYDDDKSYLLLHSNYNIGGFVSLFDEKGIIETRITDDLLVISSIMDMQSYGCSEEMYKWRALSFSKGNPKMTRDEVMSFSLPDYYRGLKTYSE